MLPLCTALLWLAPLPAFAIDGGCEEQFFQSAYIIEDGKRTFDEAKFTAFTVRTSTPVYRTATGADRTKTTLRFDEKVRVSDPGAGAQRIRVRKQSDEDLGWVEREDLLCRLFPLADSKTGLLRRVVIQTETAVKGQVVPRTAYHAPDGNVCEGGSASCPKLSRFQWYFTYAEQNGYILIAEAANLGGRDARLVGWLPAADGISWNTAVALRPAEALGDRKGADGAKESHLCAYPTLDSMKDATGACRPVLGGKRWYTTDVRLPILRDLGQTYQVAISSAAASGNFDEALSLAGIDALKNIDLFFVIDGTSSMQYAIDAIKGKPGYPGVVDQIRQRVKGKLREGGAIRYGYRIYRDSVKGGTSGVEDDGLPLGEDCGQNDAEFDKKFQTVRTYDTPGDTDFQENVFGGLFQAGRDFASCPNHLKIVVVIGDHGYNPDEQRRRGHRAYDIDAVAARFMRGAGRLNTQPVLVFIQGPDVSSDPGINNKDAYRKAYSDFDSQGHAILGKVYGSFQAEGISTKVNPAEYYFTMPSRQPDSAMIDAIIARVDGWLQPDVIGKLTTRVRNGESVIQAINALQRGDNTNVPILYWSVVADALCRRLGSQCTKQVLEGVFPAYIPHSDDLSFDVLLSQSQLDNWREILGKFKAGWAQLRTGDSSRNQIINTLVESIGSVLKLNIDDSGKTLGEFAQLSGGLPQGGASKLMAYAPEELRDAHRVEMCEIQHLANYATKKADVIQIIMDGDKMAEFKEEALPASACPTLTAKGKAVPYIQGAPRGRPLNKADENTNYSISFRKGNDRYFWVPVGYLP
jgi:hypothetical protein